MLWWLREGHFELEFHVGHQSLHIAWFGLMLKLMLLCVIAIVMLVHASTSHANLACEFTPLARKVEIVMHNGSYNMLFCVAHFLSQFTQGSTTTSLDRVSCFEPSIIVDILTALLSPELLCNIMCT